MHIEIIVVGGIYFSQLKIFLIFEECLLSGFVYICNHVSHSRYFISVLILLPNLLTYLTCEGKLSLIMHTELVHHC